MTMTIQETSKYLGLNEYTTYRLVKDGKIPAEKNEEGKYEINPIGSVIRTIIGVPDQLQLFE